MSLDPVSEQNLQGLCPCLVSKIRSAADKAAESGLYFRVYSGLRTAAQQNAIFAEGRTAPGEIRTNARAGQSSHNYGMAADIVPFMSGQSGALNWDDKTSQYEAMVGVLKAQGLAWGGDWSSFKDRDHFYIGPPNPTPQMISEYNNGTDLQAIWEKYS